ELSESQPAGCGLHRDVLGCAIRRDRISVTAWPHRLVRGVVERTGTIAGGSTERLCPRPLCKHDGPDTRRCPTESAMGGVSEHDCPVGLAPVARDVALSHQ